MKSAKRTAQVKEPIQVYLARSERAKLDRVARALGISRAEALRRGLDLLAERQSKDFYEHFSELVGSIDDRSLPTDLAENLDEHLARDLEEQNRTSGRRSS